MSRRPMNSADEPLFRAAELAVFVLEEMDAAIAQREAVTRERDALAEALRQRSTEVAQLGRLVERLRSQLMPYEDRRANEEPEPTAGRKDPAAGPDR